MTDAIETQKRVATRNIILFMIGKVISLLGASIYTFVAGLYVLQLTGSGMNFAITLVCGMLPRIVFGPIAGVIADRINRKALVVGSELVSCLVMMGASLIAYTWGPSLLLLYVSTMFLAICSTFFSVAFSAAIPTIVEDERIQNAGALNQAASSFSSILGPILGGMFFGFVTIQLFMLISGITFLVATIMELFIVFDLFEENKDDKKESFFQSIREGYLYVEQEKGLFAILKIAFWVNFFFASLLVSLPYIVVQRLLFTPNQYGLIEGMIAVGMMGASIVLSVRKETKNKYRTVHIGLIILALLLLLTSFPLFLQGDSKKWSFVFYLLMMVFIGMTIITINIPIQVLIQRTTLPSYRGRVFGLVETISTAITPLGMIIFGVLLDYVSTVMIPLVAGFALLFITVRGMQNMKREKIEN